REEASEEKEPAEAGEDPFEMRLAPQPDRDDGCREEERSGEKRVPPRLGEPARRPGLERKARREPAPGGKRRQGEREDHAGVEAVGGGERENRQDEQVIRPLGPEEAELGLEVGEVGAEEEHAEQQEIVRGDMACGGGAPRERGRAA